MGRDKKRDTPYSIAGWEGAVKLPTGWRGTPPGFLARLIELGYPVHWQGGGLLSGFGWLWTGEIPKSKRKVCGARTRKGTPCQARAVGSGSRCRMHGGLSTGPKTAEGRTRIAESNRRRAQLRREAKAAAVNQN